MIKVSFQAGIGLIYDVNDWFELRTKYRIIGEFFGCTKLYQVSLPLAISAEEIHLLIKKKIVTLVKYEKLLTEPTIEDKLKFDEEVKRLLEEQVVLLREERKNQVEQHADQIINGKKLENTSREKVIQEELNKLPPLEEKNIIFPVYTKHPEYLAGIPTEVDISEIFQYTNQVKCLVYEDLWEKGFFITSGMKFGGDFLVYLGDPVSFHANYIVKCVENPEQSFNVTEIVANGRLGQSVKKKFVLASINYLDLKVSYISINWFNFE